MICNHTWRLTPYRNRAGKGGYYQCKNCGIIGKPIDGHIVALSRQRSDRFLARVLPAPVEGQLSLLS